MQVYLQFEISSLCLSPSFQFTPNSLVLWGKGGTSRRCPSAETACQQSSLSFARAPHSEPLMPLHRYEFWSSPSIPLPDYSDLVSENGLFPADHYMLEQNISTWLLVVSGENWSFGETWNHNIHRHAVSAPSLYIILRSFRETNWNSQTLRLMEG